MNNRRGNQRGAALILEIIIYLVIVALIAVAVTSGVRAVKDLVFASHARGDLRSVQTWMEKKYTEDNVYPGTATGQGMWTFTDAPLMTRVGTTGANSSAVTAINGANAGYCIVVNSQTISDPKKVRFWMSSANPGKIMQSGTASMEPAGQWETSPASGVPGLNCWY